MMFERIFFYSPLFLSLSFGSRWTGAQQICNFFHFCAIKMALSCFCSRYQNHVHAIYRNISCCMFGYQYRWLNRPLKINGKNGLFRLWIESEKKNEWMNEWRNEWKKEKIIIYLGMILNIQRFLYLVFIVVAVVILLAQNTHTHNGRVVTCGVFQVSEWNDF